jgi:hypothetical protein
LQCGSKGGAGDDDDDDEEEVDHGVDESPQMPPQSVDPAPKQPARAPEELEEQRRTSSYDDDEFEGIPGSASRPQVDPRPELPRAECGPSQIVRGRDGCGGAFFDANSATVVLAAAAAAAAIW